MSADMAPSIGDVAEQLLIRHHSAVELVNRLVRMELVHRYRDPADRRQVRISLTPLAEEKLATLANVHLEELRAVRPLLTRLLRHFSNCCPSLIGFQIRRASRRESGCQSVSITVVAGRFKTK